MLPKFASCFATPGIMEEGKLMKMTKTRIFPINENLTVMVPVTFHILAAATGTQFAS